MSSPRRASGRAGAATDVRQASSKVSRPTKIPSRTGVELLGRLGVRERTRGSGGRGSLIALHLLRLLWGPTALFTLLVACRRRTVWVVTTVRTAARPALSKERVVRPPNVIHAVPPATGPAVRGSWEPAPVADPRARAGVRRFHVREEDEFLPPPWGGKDGCGPCCLKGRGTVSTEFS